MAEIENLSPSILTREDGATIAYHRRRGRGPGVVFLGGFMSDMSGTKALALDRFCESRGQAFVRFDYFGHGRSSGTFADATVSRWRDDALAVLDTLTDGPQIVVGSSFGGWIMLLLAAARPQRVKALIGIAAAPDATEDLMWAQFPPEVRQRIERDGAAAIPSTYSEQGYLITRRLIEDGRKHLLMRSAIAFDGPVRLLHGMRDDDVPWQRSLALAERLAAADVRITLVKDGDHRLSRDADLGLLMRTLGALLD
ncbi:MAG: alpha/beta hydrolase [Alphaproteobacteria bacterium]|nr:alpha/beta hydrolase [Alphaproteobacteria bacterium]MDE2513570.1 alpha/beta hydrolase [Alphaproteobacteria bacterium]